MSSTGTESEGPAKSPWPMLGQHTDEVLQDWLGLDGTAVEELKKEGAVK